MEQQKTIYQAVKESIDIINAIRIQVADMQSTGVQLLRAVDNLNGCIAAWDHAAARKGAEAEEARTREAPALEDLEAPRTAAPAKPAKADKP